MRAGRQMLRAHNISEASIGNVMLKAYKNKDVKCFDRMTPNARGSIVPTPHFCLSQWLKAQLKHIGIMRSDAVAKNKALYKEMLDVWIKIKLKEKK